LEDEIKKFLGLMAGTGFFKDISIHHWLNSLNWQSNNVMTKFKKSFLEISFMKNGQNYIKSVLVLHSWWRNFA